MFVCKIYDISSSLAGFDASKTRMRKIYTEIFGHHFCTVEYFSYFGVRILLMLGTYRWSSMGSAYGRNTQIVYRNNIRCRYTHLLFSIEGFTNISTFAHIFKLFQTTYLWSDLACFEQTDSITVRILFCEVCLTKKICSSKGGVNENTHWFWEKKHYYLLKSGKIYLTLINWRWDINERLKSTWGNF